MPFTHYRLMPVEQATAALEEFLTERPAALGLLRTELTTHGVDPDAMLDGFPSSLTPLWNWIAGRRAEFALDPATSTQAVPREQWPSWARHAVTGVKVPSSTMIVLVDGLVSYLALVIITGAPNVRWGLGSPEDSHHHLHHHPVLIGHGRQVFVPTLPMGGMMRLRRGERSLHATELEEYAAGAIVDLGLRPTAVLESQDSLVVVVAEPECFDIGVHPVIADRSPDLVDRMARELAGLDGIVSAHRSAPDALQVDAPSWHADELERWLIIWMKANSPFIR
ncbi:hypothetical protein [Kocuria dechangensis]|nr:hypothetical protein [Kocuria dechangensis]